MTTAAKGQELAWRFNRSASWARARGGRRLPSPRGGPGRDVLIWAYEPETLAGINQNHRNETYLPGVKLDPRDRGDRAAERGRQLRSPADGDARPACAQDRRRDSRPISRPEQPLVLCSKGIEQTTGKLISRSRRGGGAEAADRGAVGAELCRRGRARAARRGHARHAEKRRSAARSLTRSAIRRSAAIGATT